MGGKSFFKGIKLSKKELAALGLSLFTLFFTAFFIGGAIAKSKATAAAGVKPVIVNKAVKQSLAKENEKERNEDRANKKIGRELEKTREEEAARRAEELARIEAQQRAEEGKVVYLTFDDGPSTTVTPRILDVLKKYNVKATFFVIGNLAERNTLLVKREVMEGHSVCNHTYSHVYQMSSSNSVYRSTEALVDDFAKGEGVLKSIISDYSCKVVRFPGGSYNRGSISFEPFRAAVKNAGYHFVDWNLDSLDTKQVLVPADTLVNAVKQGCGGKRQVVILMHDAPVKSTTADALPRIIEYLKEQGYAFKTFQ